MPTLNDILTANGDYTPVSGYPVDDKYENDSPVINVYDRTIGEIVGDTSTSGENVSQYLTFRIPRHPDHYDLIENGTNIRILYRLEDDTGEDVVPVNVVANDDYIIFGWKIPLIITVKPGVVTFIIHAYKSENNLITYHYKTLPKTYRILETMETDVVVPEIEMYNLAEAYARGTITDVFGHTRPVEENEPGYHDNSKYYKELAGTSKIDAETAKNAAEVAQKAAETAQHAAENARDQAVAIVGGEYVSYGQTQSLNDTQKNKARENIGATGPNGYYPNMTVGLSENFVGTGEPTRRIFNYDTAGGSADISDGNAEIEKMYGGTVAWNQMVKELNATNWIAEKGVTISFEDDIIVVSSTTVNNGAVSVTNSTFKNGHKYLVTSKVKTETDLNNVIVGATKASGISKATSIQAGQWVDNSYVAQSIVDGTVPLYCYAQSTQYSNLRVKYFMIFDLTQMFGSTIADDIYSLEQSQAGAGVAWFKKLFPKDYYPYDEGTLLNVNPAGIKTVGFNAYDKATGKAELIGGNQYQITGTYTSLSYSTGEVLTPDSTGCFTPTKTGELTVTGGGENTCVHLTWSGYRNGDYEDYWARTRDINIQPYFPDGLKRAGTVYDEISKDKAIKRIGVVDLGSLDWQYRETESPVSPYFYTNVSGIKSPGALYTNPINAICSKYPIVIRTDSTFVDGTLCGDGTVTEVQQIQIKDSSYTNATTFKSAMSGVMLYYELETPVETQIDPPLNLLYQVSDFGTEQFLGAGATEPKTLPIIADIVYGVNYRDTIKNLPKNYAKVKGYYPDLYTGLADNLIDRKGNGTPQEISYRTSCGDDSIADDGNGIIQSIFGNTVVWNQLINGDGHNQNITFSNGKFTYSDFASGVWNLNTNLTLISGHKYYAKASKPFNNVYVLCYTNDIAHKFFEIGRVENDEVVLDTIVTCNYTASDYRLYINRYGATSDTPVSNYEGYVMLIDLTQMFGAGNEPSTLDDPRIKWIKDYANEYPEYNSGELISYKGNGIMTVGFNQLDMSRTLGTLSSHSQSPKLPLDFTKYYVGLTRNNYYNPSNVSGVTFTDTTVTLTTLSSGYGVAIPMRCFPNTTYYFKASASSANGRISVGFYDGDGNYISDYDMSYNGSNLFTTPANCRVVTLVFLAVANTESVTFHDICINLSWSGYRNGEYEPYWSRILNLPISTYFPDGMKSAGSVRDELTKDKAVKRIGVVDLGTLEWKYDSTYDCFNADPRAISGTMKDNPKLVCSKYPFVGPFTKLQDKACAYIYLRTIAIRDSSYNQDATAFKAAMSGVMLVYELAEPIETTITPPLDLTYKVADFGTEESITEVKSTPFNGIIKYSDDFTRGLVNMPKNYDTTASLDALAASLSTMLTSALNGTVTITRGAYDPATKKYEWNCQFTKNQVN